MLLWEREIYEAISRGADALEKISNDLSTLNERVIDYLDRVEFEQMPLDPSGEPCAPCGDLEDSRG